MIEAIDKFDKELLLWINSHNSSSLDQVMYMVSHKFFWIPLYALVVFFIFRQFGKQGFFVLIGIALVVTIADQFTSSFMKPFFERPRPCHDPVIGQLVHIVNGKCGGKFGFASSHAANSFGVAAFLWFVLRRHIKWISVMLVWAVLVSYSRIYLGVHYPADIAVGAIVGILAAILVYWLYVKFVSSRFNLNQKANYTS